MRDATRASAASMGAALSVVVALAGLPGALEARAGSAEPTGLVDRAESVGQAAPRARSAPTVQFTRQVEVSSDPRSVILLRYDCRSDIGRREVSLFGNGVIRLRESQPEVAEGEGELAMRLHTLDPDAFDGYRNRIEDEDLSGVAVERSGVDGEWVEQCVFEVLDRDAIRADDRGLLRHFEFSPYSRLPLTLSRVLRVAEELVAEVETPVGPGLPLGYEAEPGDVLERVDGELFRVVAYTVDRKGVELQGVQAPLVLYVSPDDLPKRFVRLVSRARQGIR